MSEPVSFPLFAVMWNQLQKQSTPMHHVRMARWLQNENNPLRLLMAFRGSGKSTLVGLYCAWRLLCDQNARVLVLAADDALARKMVRQVKRILERHPLTKSLRPRFADQWASDRFTINRSLELRDPSMLAKGIGANLTGCRADIIICDDVEVPNTCDTPEKRAELRERLAELSYILSPAGHILYAGTPHHSHSLYQENEDNLTGELPFLSDASRFVLPVLSSGHSNWPERFSLCDIERIKRQSGPLKFASQMMLQPVSLHQSRLDADALYIRDDIPLPHITQKVASWDPSFGMKNSDGSVLAIINGLRDGTFHIADIVWVTASENVSQDNATQQCHQVIWLLKRYEITRLLLESNGIGKFLPAILRRELKTARYSCAVIETTQRANKAERILSAFDPLLAARALSVSSKAAKSPLIDELKNYSPQDKHARDDGLDAVATALLALSVSLPPRKGNTQ